MWPGSSPRVRGTLRGQLERRIARGIIPACAGNTPSRSAWGLTLWDHPRVCGEHLTLAITALTTKGSSPRVRGTRFHGNAHCCHLGIIPACAGNTLCATVALCKPRDHPRVCGEHADVMSARIYGRGIIPACAGNTGGAGGGWQASRDHPRVCGEHLLHELDGLRAGGSSPRVRGTPRRATRLEFPSGIIPACAGNTQRVGSRPFHSRDHPRVCGEHTVSLLAVTVPSGSSPRVRGTHLLRFAFAPTAGIIPACAGNTPPLFPPVPLSWDHPRVCGEHSKAALLRSATLGSSPRVRGTL